MAMVTNTRKVLCVKGKIKLIWHIIIIIFIWHYSPLWVFAFSARSLQVPLSFAVSFQFFIFSFFKSSMASSCHRCLGLPTGLVPIGFDMTHRKYKKRKLTCRKFGLINSTNWKMWKNKTKTIGALEEIGSRVMTQLIRSLWWCYNWVKLYNSIYFCLFSELLTKTSFPEWLASRA